MPIDFINDDLTFKPGFEQHLPADVREIAKDCKTLPDTFKRIAESQRDFHNRIKIPDTPEGKREVLTKYFKDVLDSDAAAKQKADADAKTAAEEAAKVQKAKDAKTALETSQVNAKKVLGGEDAKAVETNTEIARRAFRGDKCPPWIKEGIAKAAGVEPDKLTDDQIKAAIASDPAVAQTLLTIGNLTRDGRLESGDGHSNGKQEEKPGQPSCPDLYKNLPDTHPEKQWFIRRGFNFQTMEWGGRPPQ